MTRTYQAKRRTGNRAPVEFNIGYVETVPVLDDDGQPTGLSREVERAEHFVCRGTISALTLSEFAHNADVDAATPEGAAILRDVFAEAFGTDAEAEAEYRRFFKVARRHLDDDELVEIIGGLIEDFGNRPTVRPSTSPEPSVTTGTGSRVVSLPGGFSTQATPIEAAPRPVPMDHLGHSAHSA